ncbi:hypothetical protein Q8A73_004701 [Channa argus]|nr:hypothetical protein Q8A73_004701 [Channa argus]
MMSYMMINLAQVSPPRQQVRIDGIQEDYSSSWAGGTLSEFGKSVPNQGPAVLGGARNAVWDALLEINGKHSSQKRAEEDMGLFLRECKSMDQLYISPHTRYLSLYVDLITCLELRHHLEQLASLMGGIASKLATMKRQIMSGRVVDRERGQRYLGTPSQAFSVWNRGDTPDTSPHSTPLLPLNTSSTSMVTCLKKLLHSVPHTATYKKEFSLSLLSH